MRCLPNVGLMLGQRRRHWPYIGPTLRVCCWTKPLAMAASEDGNLAGSKQEEATLLNILIVHLFILLFFLLCAYLFNHSVIY